LLTDHVTLSPAEVLRMRARFGDKVLQMGHLEDDGSMSIPVDSIVEAVQSIGGQRLSEALEDLKSEQMEALVELIVEVQRRKLGQMVGAFQREPDGTKAHRQWKEIEKTVFGVEYPIGIGAAVTRRPLPHHRAYGSVHGGSSRLR
jgi:hypothetical protein